MAFQLHDAITQAQTQFGLTLKPEQYSAVVSYSRGYDTVLLAPTGFGKSLIFQIAPLVYQHAREIMPTFAPKPDLDTDHQFNHDLFLVLMPLTALTSDAANKVNTIHGGSFSALQLNMASVKSASAATFLFSSPEFLMDGSGRKLLEDHHTCQRVRAVFVDEMHIVQTW